jgi:hypothetical protein
MQNIEEPSVDDKFTTAKILSAFTKGPEQEVYRGMLNAVLAGEANFRGQG